jgi:hypothetical protein
MITPLSVGLFIDFDGIRHELLRHYGREPDCQAWMEKARRFGPVAVAYAYADFTQHPALFRRKLDVAGITARDVPQRSPDITRPSSIGMAMLMDIVDCLLDWPNVATLVLMTGDTDFVRVTARARNRFGKQVVVSGVPGTVPTDLIESADLYDPLEVSAGSTTDAPGALSVDERDLRLLQLVDWLARHRPYMTFGFIRAHAASPHHGLQLTEDGATELLSRFKERGILIERFVGAADGRTLRTLELCEDHPALIASRRVTAPRFEGGPTMTPNGRVEP